jgi:uncharacterized protein YcaQ
MAALTLDALRRHALARSLFTPTTLPQALQRLGYVQADPLRAPARAQDLILRQRVKAYRHGDLERRYPQLDVQEDFFLNYGFVASEVHHLMHPRRPRRVWDAARSRQAEAVLDFVRAQGVVHPRAVDAHFQHGKTTNWFGGSSRASTELLDGMHDRGLLRVARREGGTRLYAARVASRAELQAQAQQHEDPAHAAAVIDRLVDLGLQVHAPLPRTTLLWLVNRVRSVAVPQWMDQHRSALARTLARLPSAEVEGRRWYWPAGEDPLSRRHARIDSDERVRLLAPFDPVVWDRLRFELFWGWAYRFEAYTPAAKRERGHYALPLLWRGQVIGWANAAVTGGVLRVQPGFVSGQPPREPAFARGWDNEVLAMAKFLGVRAAG